MNKITLAIGMLMAGLVAALGLYLFLKGAHRIQLAEASRKWPVTAGKVVSSQTTREVSTTRDVDTHRKIQSVIFNTTTTIGYAVDGKDYTTTLLRFGQTLGSGDKSDAALQGLRYPEGTVVPVSYNPSNPATAVMKPGLHTEAFWLPGAGLAFLLPAVLGMFLLPGILRDFTDGNKDFENYVERSIQERRTDLPEPPLRQPGDKAMPVAALAFGAVFCCLGLLALTAGLERMWHGKASESWPTAPGVVTATGADEPNDTSDSAYRARILYRYEVNGVAHFNNLRRFAQVDSTAVYKTGQHVKVSYSPADPDTAVLEPGNTGASMVIPGIGVVLLLFSLAVFWWVVPAVGKR
jgi:hypothetical protein